MIKVIILVASALGVWFLTNRYFPQAHTHGIHIQGYMISFAVIAVVAMSILVYRVKTK